MKSTFHVKSLMRMFFVFVFVFTSFIATRADVIADWNLITLQEAVAAGRPGGSPAIDFATVHAAMYDAVQAIEKDYDPYRVTDVPNATGSPIAAAAKAARDVLVYRFPARADQINTTYLNYLAANFIEPTDPGIAVGAYVAGKLLAYRACDGSLPIPAPTFVGGTGIGQWRPTPTAFSPMNPGEYLGQVTPFFMTKPTQFRPAPPPAVNSNAYTRDYNEVKLYGAKTGSLRSADQTDLANFWAGNTFAAVYSGVRNVAAKNVDNVSDNSRLFALVAMSMADTIIGVWDAKFHYNYWRPQTAIQLGAVDGNPDTVGDPAWESLILNPAYPDYTSGANGVSSSALFSMEHFFGTDHMDFSMMTTNTGPTILDTRDYTRFSQAVQEVVDGRVLLGIHFRFADEVSVKMGQSVVKWGFNNYLRPSK
ncbi:MAG TPA: vanadium-dependent haloperoxidase [Pyrinomonadaceae bacterium]|nr:vanadium-dependent haloperoxidase [Pyrinomonadaceae bacterium]